MNNKALRNFKVFTFAAIAAGVLATWIGVALASNNLETMDFNGLATAIALTYAGLGLIALGITGAFLRQTAKAIVEGMGGNTLED